VSKARKKEKKKKEKEKSSALEGSVHRALGDSESSSVDELPLSPPNFTFKHHVYTVAPEPAFTDELTFAEEEETETETKEKKPKTFDDTVVRYTRFNSVATPSKIVERVGEVLKSMSLKYSTKENFKLKVEVRGVVFFVQVFADPKVESQYVVDFRKQKGSSLEFRSFYQDVRAHLADIILQPKKS